jgi:hypothetical protein
MLIERRIREEINEPLKVTGITLLSLEEYEQAKKHIPMIRGWWWLRSPGGSSNSAAYVMNDGWVDTYGNGVDYTNIVVRPALLISNLDSFNLKLGDRIVDFCRCDWTVIPGNMVLCDTGVGTHCFREDWGAPDANDYEKSDVKAWLENWAKERGIINAVL